MGFSQFQRSAQQHQDDRISTQEHLRNEAIFVDLPAFLPVGQTRCLCPHLLDVLKHHVAVSVEGLDSRQQLLVVAAGYQDLCVVSHGGLEDGQRAGLELVVLERGDFELREF